MAGDGRKCRINAARRQKTPRARLTQSEGAWNSAEEGPACSENRHPCSPESIDLGVSGSLP